VFVTVTPNAAIDRTRHVATLEAGAAAPALAEHAQAGGKGVNVARVLRRLGEPVLAVVLVGGRAGAWLCGELRHSGIEVLAVEAPGESRTCLELVEAGTGRVRQIHGPGVEACEAVAERLVEATRGALSGARWLALCGSLPPGLPVRTAGRLLEEARRAGVRCAVDTRGPALPEAWARDPDLVRVNREEAAEALGLASEALPPPPYPALGRPELGVVSDGPRPFHAWAGATRFEVEPPRVRARNPIGCGDAMLAGLLARLAAGAAFEAALRFGTALAAADAESETAGRPDPERARSLLPLVSLRKLGSS
jgi:tagatose 6-phosphate kinase